LHLYLTHTHTCTTRMHLFSWQANNEKDDEDADRIGSPKLATKDVATDLATLVKNEDDAGNNVPQVKMEPMESDDDDDNLHSVCCKRIVKLEVQMEQSSQEYQARIRQLEQQQLQDIGNNEPDRSARKIVELEAQLQARNAQNDALQEHVVWLEQEIQRVTVNCCCAVVPRWMPCCFSSKPLLLTAGGT
jgi:hypothetical protein